MIEKLAADGAEFYGAYTLVNGRVWPYAGSSLGGSGCGS